jgi:spore maturation protein CgeB
MITNSQIQIADASVLCLTATDCGISALKKHGLGLDPGADLDAMFVQPLRGVFSTVIVYDYYKQYADVGVGKANRALLDIVASKRPQYLVWPSMDYEILEDTFQRIRQLGTIVIGWFLDDEMRFDNYSRWWAPYLDHCLTNDLEAVQKYKSLGVSATHMVLGSNDEVFRRLNLPYRFDVSFVGRKFGERGKWVEALRDRGVKIHTWGNGWPGGLIPTEEMVAVFNASKINLNFVKSCGVNTRPQLKARIFEVCMSGGFLLCEYIPGIEEFFVPDKEIVCFQEFEELEAKIRYYLKQEDRRRAIARAGWDRAHHDYTSVSRLRRAFAEIQGRVNAGNHRVVTRTMQAVMPGSVRSRPSSYHLGWAKGLMKEAYPIERVHEEINLALHYDPGNVAARRLRVLARMPVALLSSVVQLNSWWRILKGWRSL